MTDRELLEAAARAAGAKPYVDEAWPGLCLSDDPQCLPFFVNIHGSDARTWNPIDHDGDALRLAVKLKIDLHFEDQPNWIGELVEAVSPQNADGVAHCEVQALGDDSDAAVRRAIVLTAAALAERGGE